MFISFSFIAIKRERNRTKEREKRKGTIRRRQKTDNAVICVFACRQKSLSAAKDNAARL